MDGVVATEEGHSENVIVAGCREAKCAVACVIIGNDKIFSKLLEPVSAKEYTEVANV